MQSNDTQSPERKKHLLDQKRIAFGAVALILLLLVFSSVAGGQLNGLLEVSFIDVGQGDSILLGASDGTHVLVDTGYTWAGATVVAHLREQGVEALDVVVMSHMQLNPKKPPGNAGDSLAWSVQQIERGNLMRFLSINHFFVRVLRIPCLPEYVAIVVW